MSEDRRRTGQHESNRDGTLRRWIAGEVHPYSAPVREQLDASGLGRRGLRGASDLARLPVTELADLGDGRSHVLEPSADRIRAAGRPELRARLLAADVLGRREGFVARDVDAPYKPVQWDAACTPAGVLLTGWTTTDLDRLTRLGRRSLAVAGITVGDRVARTETPACGVGALQLELGARDAGVAQVAVDIASEPGTLAAVAPTVVTGTPASLGHAVAAGLPDSVRVLVAHLGTGGGAGLAGLARRAGRPVRLWWSPPGVRAAWVTCEADQLHTWPDHEHLEVVDDQGRPAPAGRLVWSAVGWRGSVWLRVALGPLGRVDRTPCGCGRTTPRVLPMPRSRAS